MESTGIRLLKIGEARNLNRQEFAAQLGVSAGVLSHISSGRNNPSLELITSALKVYTDINPEWLLFGEGPMYRNREDRSEKTELIKLVLEMKLINEMNYNVLKEKIELLEQRIKAASE